MCYHKLYIFTSCGHHYLVPEPQIQCENARLGIWKGEFRRSPDADCDSSYDTEEQKEEMREEYWGRLSVGAQQQQTSLHQLFEQQDQNRMSSVYETNNWYGERKGSLGLTDDFLVPISSTQDYGTSLSKTYCNGSQLPPTACLDSVIPQTPRGEGSTDDELVSCGNPKTHPFQSFRLSSLCADCLQSRKERLDALEEEVQKRLPLYEKYQWRVIYGDSVEEKGAWKSLKGSERPLGIGEVAMGEKMQDNSDIRSVRVEGISTTALSEAGEHRRRGVWSVMSPITPFPGGNPFAERSPTNPVFPNSRSPVSTIFTGSNITVGGLERAVSPATRITEGNEALDSHGEDGVGGWLKRWTSKVSRRSKGES